MTAVPDYPDWSAADPSGRFTDWLRERSDTSWAGATSHRFVDELAHGTLSEDHFRRYLVQDYGFIETLVTLVGYAVAYAPDMAAKKTWTEFLAVLVSDENDYFQRSFDALGVGVALQSHPPLSETTVALRAAMLDAAKSGQYADVLAVIVPAEWIYLTWASERREARPRQAYYAEWIDLHAIPEFEAFVDWLRGQLDGIGPRLGPSERQRIERRFAAVVDLEVEFFDQAYDSAQG